MQQLVFPLSAAPAPTFDSYVIGRNSEPVAALRAFVLATQSETSLYVWGQAGSGKTHLLSAVAAAARAVDSNVIMLSSVWSSAPVDDVIDNTLVLIDDVERLDAAGQAGLFNLYNAVRERSARLVAAGALPPSQLPLRADVNTRLGWGLVYQLHALSDDEKVAALRQHARARGFELPEEVSTYLIRHGRRDLPWLMAALDALDQQSLAAHRAVTVPLLREILENLAPDAADNKNVFEDKR